MNNTSEGEANSSRKARRETSAVAFAHAVVDGVNSRTPVCALRDTAAADSEAIDDRDADPRRVRRLIRSRSEDVTPRVREQWGKELWDQGALKESMMLLQSSVADYEKEASQQQWKDLLKINADVANLGKLARGAQKSKSKNDRDDESPDGLSKFTMVALEYSKMLDVVMNQSPEYAGLAWGVIRMLLVAHTNHSKLKHAVEHYIIQFGQDFGVVNHLMNFHPTEKMIEAVCEAYAAFSKFLAKAVKYYKESKMMSAIKALGFPWETRFQLLVDKIECAFKRIKDIANAGHFGLTVQTHEMVEMLGCGQEKMRYEMRRNTVDLREQLKIEMRGEVQSLFEAFDRNWVSRFEQIMIQSIQGHTATDAAGERKTTLAGRETAAIEYAESMTETSSYPGKGSDPPSGSSQETYSLVPTSASFLADHIKTPKRLKRFRDKSFVHLQKLDNDYAKTNVRLRHTTTQDLYQIMNLLRHDTMRTWLQASSSGLIWVNTVKRAGPTDWTTMFATRIIEHAPKADNITVLYHLCGNYPTSSQVSTPVVMLQSLIMQLLQQHHKHYVRKVFPFTLEYFQHVQDDIHDLWDLLLKCCTEARVPCVWLILDYFDNLEKGKDYDFVLQALLHSMQDDSRVFKVFCSARVTGTPRLVSEATTTDPSVNTITVPKAASLTAAAMLSKHKRITRLPDKPPEQLAHAASRAEIDALLHSSSEDAQSAVEDNEDNSIHHCHHQGSNANVDRSPQSNPNPDVLADDTDLGASDSSMEFTREDPFATTDDEQSDTSPSQTANSAIRRNTDDEDEDEELFFARRSSGSRNKPSHALDLLADSESSDDNLSVSAARLKLTRTCGGKQSQELSLATGQAREGRMM